MTHQTYIKNLYKLFFFRVDDPIAPRQDGVLNNKGFTLVELITVTAVIAILASVAIPAYSKYVEMARKSSATSDIRTVSTEITAFSFEKGSYPDSLAEIKRPNFLDPWKRIYVYKNIEKLGGPLMDILDSTSLNTHFDLYSKGPDDMSFLAGGNPANNDDIVLANDGAYVGLRP